MREDWGEGSPPAVRDRDGGGPSAPGRRPGTAGGFAGRVAREGPARASASTESRDVTWGRRGPELSVGGLARHRGRLLLVKRGHAPAAGRWSLPGGRVQRGETMAQAVIREMAEETGLAVRCGPLIGFAERIGPGYHFVIADFFVDVIGRRPLRAGDDAAEVRWVPFSALEEMELSDGLLEFLDRHDVLVD